MQLQLGDAPCDQASSGSQRKIRCNHSVSKMVSTVQPLLVGVVTVPRPKYTTANPQRKGRDSTDPVVSTQVVGDRNSAREVGVQMLRSFRFGIPIGRQ